jgi:hypothetical protein
MTTRTSRTALLAALAPLAVGAILLGSPAPAAQAAPVAQAAPTDKDQCKDGNWRQFTTLGFKNQGECVSFVNDSGGGGGGGAPVDPAATPELGSLALFGSGAAGFAGYALTRLRAGRMGARKTENDETDEPAR